jgi:2-C-methyl-D-erythritol 4-phosphate cytidylyltransferase
MYPYGALKKAMTTVINNPSVKSKITDECSSMEHIDYESIIVESEDFNMKITYSGDWPLAEAFLKGSAN